LTNAARNYEPTPGEVESWVEDMYAASDRPGSHGTVEMIPTMERYIWRVEGIYWGHREVLVDGRVSIGWVRPPEQIAECIEGE